MSFLFSHWKDEETPEQKYNDIVGGKTEGRTLLELLKDIESSLENNFISKIERKKLLSLIQEINNNEDQ